MAEGRSHAAVANRLARMYGTEPNAEGVDIVTPSIAIEVETEDTIGEAGLQLQGHRKPVYVAPTTQKGVEDALDRFAGTSIGVMDSQGRIVKRSTR